MTTESEPQQCVCIYVHEAVMYGNGGPVFADVPYNREHCPVHKEELRRLQERHRPPAF